MNPTPPRALFFEELSELRGGEIHPSKDTDEQITDLDLAELLESSSHHGTKASGSID